MRVDFTMASTGSVDIDDSEMEGMTEAEKQEYIAEQVSIAAYEEVDSSLDWEIGEE